MSSRQELMKELCKEFSNIENFGYSYKFLLKILEEKDYFRKRKKKVIDEDTPYKRFVKAQLEQGTELKIILELWEKNKHKLKI